MAIPYGPRKCYRCSPTVAQQWQAVFRLQGVQPRDVPYPPRRSQGVQGEAVIEASIFRAGRWLVRYTGRAGWYVWIGPLCAECGAPAPAGRCTDCEAR